MPQHQYLYSKSYLVSMQQKLVLPKDFTSAIEALDYAQDNNLRPLGYNMVMKGGDVLRILGKGQVKEAPPIEVELGQGMDGKAPMFAPQIGIPHPYSSPIRKEIDYLEHLRKHDSEIFYRNLAFLKSAIEERKKGKTKKMPQFSLSELEDILKEAQSLYC
jgi:hypothetical protein